MAVDDSNTKALLHFNGADASTTFTDESGKVWTAGGNAQLDTAQFKFGTASALFDGSGDTISVADSDDWSFGTGDFTVDFWIRFNTSPGDGVYMLVQEISGANTINFGLRNSGVFRPLYVVSGGVVIADYSLVWAPSTATWYHLAFVRNSTSFLFFIDGVSQTLTVNTAIASGSMPDLAAILSIGGVGGNTLFNGWIDEFRISKGIARWTANFTPPTGEYMSPENIIVPQGVTSIGRSYKVVGY